MKSIEEIIEEIDQAILDPHVSPWPHILNALATKVMQLQSDAMGQIDEMDGEIQKLRDSSKHAYNLAKDAIAKATFNGKADFHALSKRALDNTKRSIKTSVRLGIAQDEIASLKARIETLEKNVALKADPAFEAYLNGEDYAEEDEPNEYVLCFRCQSSILEDENPQWEGKPVCEDDYHELVSEQKYELGE